IWKRIQGAVQHMRRCATQLNRVAVRSRPGGPAGTDAPIRSADVFDDDGLSKRASYVLGKDPRDSVAGAACRERHDHRDGARRVGLRLCAPRHGRERSRARCQMQEFAPRKFCCIHPERMDAQQGCVEWTTLRLPNPRYCRPALNSALATRTNAHESLLTSLGQLTKTKSALPPR